MLRFVLLLAFGAVSAAGLGIAAAAGAPAGPSASPARVPTGTIWIVTKLAGRPPVKGTELTAELSAARRISGSAGCNRYTGSYRVSGGAIRIGRLATTQMACAEPIERQETAFLQALSRARRFAVSGSSLTLTSASGRTLVTFKAQTQALAGTSWDVLAYNNGKQAVVSVLADTKLTAVFGKDGRLTGFAGCNNYHAGYEAVAPKIAIGPVASTQKACDEPPGVGEQEARYLIALETAARYRIEGSRLELRTADGAIAVTLQRT